MSNLFKNLGIGFISACLFCFTNQALATISISGTNASAVNSNNTIYYYSNISTTNDGGSPAHWVGNGTGTGCSTILNPNCRNSTDIFTLTVTVSGTTSASTLKLIAASSAISSTNNGIAGANVISSLAISGDGSYTFTPSFGSICSAYFTVDASVTANCDPTTLTAMKTMVLSAVVEDGTADGVFNNTDQVGSISLIIKSAIPVNSKDSSSFIGVYSFSTFPGDEKIYLRSLSAPTDFPSQENDVGAKYVRAYYSVGNTISGTSCSGFDATKFSTFDQFTNSGYQDIGTSTSTTGLERTYFGGLANGTTYYVKLAIVDNAGNIGSITPSDATNNVCTHTATPDQVIGLLSENQCFIATAAFDSPTSKPVMALRKFRDEVLLKTNFGRAAVSFYYKNSPAWAERLNNHPQFKPFVRTVLYPIIGYSMLATQFGAVLGGMLFFVLLFMPVLLWRSWPKKGQSS